MGSRSIASPAPLFASSLFRVADCSALTGIISPATRSLVAVTLSYINLSYRSEKLKATILNRSKHNIESDYKLTTYTFHVLVLCTIIMVDIRYTFIVL